MKLDLTQLKLGQSTQDMLAGIVSILTDASNINAALDRLDADHAAARERSDMLTAERAGLLEQRALATDPSVVRSFDPRLKALATESLEEAANLEAIEIAKQSLATKLHDIEESISEKLQFDVPQVCGAYGADVADAFQTRLKAVVSKHLLPLVLEAEALRTAMPGAGGFGMWQNELMVPQLNGVNAPLLTGQHAFIDGQRITLSSVWGERPELVEIHDAVRSALQPVANLRGYVTRSQRLASAAPVAIYRRAPSSAGPAADRRADEDWHAHKTGAAAAGFGVASDSRRGPATRRA